MKIAECISKNRDRLGRIQTYTLSDSKGKMIELTRQQLKLAMQYKRIKVINLQLNTDGRIIESEVIIWILISALIK